MLLGRIDWSPKPEKIRSFALTLIVAALILTLVVGFLGSWGAAIWVASVGICLGVVGYFLPAVGRVIYLIWMGVSYLLGRFTSPLVIGLIFYLVISPLGLIRRLLGRDSLRLRDKGLQDSYFCTIEDHHERERFDRQF